VDIQSLQDELKATQDVARTAMNTSSDLGLAVQFMKDSFSMESYAVLANHLMDSLKQLGFTSCLSIDTYAGRTFICDANTGAEASSIEQSINDHALDGRVIEFEHSIQINYEKSSLLVRYEEIEQNRLGQLRDMLVLLMEGVEARVKSLVLEEQAREARQSKDEFFALMSHELRTPLNPIIGYATRMEKQVGKKIEESFRAPISAIKYNGEGLLRLINHIIDLASIDSGSIELNKIKFDLQEITDRACFKVENQARQKRTIIDRQVQSGMMFVADVARFSDILISVLSYSIGSSSDHKITIRARFHYKEVDGLQLEYLVVELEDDAETVSEAYRTKIFESISDRNLGSIYTSNDLGIGLFLTKRLIELHDGWISLHPVEGGGNIFEIWMPSREQ